MNDRMILMCAPNGARLSKNDHSALPLTPNELAECAEEIIDAGASLIHIHVRNANGGHTLDVEAYRRALDAIRSRIGDQLVLQITTEAVGIYSPMEQEVLIRDLKPEAVSIALREMCPDDSAEAAFARLFEWMKAEKVFPQIILYDMGDLGRFEDMRQRGIFATDMPFILYVLGSYQNPGNITHTEIAGISQKLSALNTPWSFCGFGENESLATQMAAQHGGHMRVGFENNRLIPGQGEAGNNAQLVHIAADAAREARREVANASHIRQIFNEWFG